MITSKEVIAEIDYFLTLTTIMETYQEIAASRMQQIRISVVQNRDFLLEINYIFQQVKSSYKSQIERLLRHKKLKEAGRISFVKHNGKKLSVLLSPNTGLYGDIPRRTFNLFSQELQKEKTDATIIGKVGLKFFQEEFPDTIFSYFELPEEKFDPNIFKSIVNHLVQYENVLVFYPQFQNIINQQPSVISISGDRLPSQQQVEEIKYFFEPSLRQILELFEKEIFSSIFEQTIREYNLAKFASRMNALEAATDNTRDKLKQMLLQKERIRHQAMNKKQREIVTTQVLWGKI